MQMYAININSLNFLFQMSNLYSYLTFYYLIQHFLLFYQALVILGYFIVILLEQSIHQSIDETFPWHRSIDKLMICH